jgi:Ribonuclease G/E
MRLILSALLLAAVPVIAADLPEGPAKAILMRACDGCHRATDIPGYKHTKQEWIGTLDRMQKRGAPLKVEEVDVVIDYLAANFPKVVDETKVNVNKASAEEISKALDLTLDEAKLIVEHREKYRMFRWWQDLYLVYDLDGRKIDKVKDRIGL